MMRKLLFSVLLMAVCTLLTQGSALAERPGSVARSLQKAAISDQQTIDANNWAVEVKNNGQYGYDAAAGNAGGEFPRGSGTTIIFAAGMYIGVFDPVSQKPLVSHIEFDSEYQPGRITNEGVPVNQLVADDPNSATNRVYIINRDGTGDWGSWPMAEGAPADAEGNPLLVSDQDSWCVWNDLDPDRHGSDNTQPIGLEVQMQSYMFAASGALGDIFFMKWDITNKTNVDYDSAYVGLWYDPDVDDASNDLVASDPVRGVGYVYNNTDDDNPVVFGVDFFQGPLVDAPGETAVIPILGAGGQTMSIPDKKILPMTSLSFYINGTDPDTDVQRYNLMAGLTLEGTPRSSDQAVGGFDFPGDPVTGTGGPIDASATDKRFLVVTGPFALKAGETQTIIAAEMGAQGADRLNAITVMRSTDEVAQQTFNNGFITPKAPSAPVVSANASDGQVILTWNNKPEVELDTYGEMVGLDGYIADDHQGYRVYRSTTGLTGSWTLLAEYDASDGITDVARTYFDPNVGEDVRVPVHIGTDSGLRYSFIDPDVINGMTYYYAITAYDYQAIDATDRTLEAPQGANVIRVVPMKPPAGYRFQAQVDTTATHTTGASDGAVDVIIIDPAQITGHQYEVRFASIDGHTYWKLVDKNTNADVVYDTRVNDPATANVDERIYIDLQALPGDDVAAGEFPVTDGIQVQVYGPPLAAKDAVYSGGDRWHSGDPANGGEVMFGSIFLAPNFIGSSVPAGNYPGIEIRWGGASSYTDVDGNGQLDPGEPYEVDMTKEHQGAFMYVTWGPGRYEGFNEVPFTAWDTDANPPRQLNVVVRDRDNNGLWDLHTDDTPFNYTWIMSSNYDATGMAYNPASGTDYFDGPVLEPDGAGVFDALYAIWAYPRGSRAMLANAGVLAIEPNRVNVAGADVFSFNTTLLMQQYDAERAKDDMENIKVVPNPYLGTSVYNLSQFDRRLKFTGLPENCKIRIFTVAGDLVRTIDHGGNTTNNRIDNQPFAGDDPAAAFTSIEEWDLKTSAGAYVASGFYVAHVEAPGIGETFVKFAIVQEKEIIQSPVEGR